MSVDEATLLAMFPPPAAEVINLALADLAIACILLPLSGYIAFKHGLNGMVCWPLLVSFFAMRIIADAFVWKHRNDANVAGTASIMTTAGSIACMSLAIIGFVYEANVIMPQPPKRWTEKIILGVTHLINTGGIGMATYGSTPSATGEGGVANSLLNKLGNVLMVCVMVFVTGWCYPTFKKIQANRTYPNAKPAMTLLRLGMIALPFHLIRLVYTTTYAFDPVASLSPTTGSFATKLVLIFFTQLGAALALVAAGWFSMDVLPKARIEMSEDLCDENPYGATDIEALHRGGNVELVGRKH